MSLKRRDRLATPQVKDWLVHGQYSPQLPVMEVSFLIVAGGGSGGGGYGGGGGGGAGGVLEGTVELSVATTITVGNGGNATSAQGVDGENSQLGDLVAIGGGGGGNMGQNGSNGGSGGGASFAGTAVGGTTTQTSNGGTGYGNNGGASTSYGSPEYGGGGGGGAGAVGGIGTDNAGGNGGDGIQSSISGTATYYAGGGGGGGASNVGGQGGGGQGGQTNDPNNGVAGSPATPNTGGGGGGGHHGYSQSGAGGSGIVIIRRLTADGDATGGTITIDGDYTIHTFTESGTFTPFSSISAFPTSGCEFYYRLDEASGTTAYDSTENSNNGSNTNAVVASTGIIMSGYLFGGDAYIEPSDTGILLGLSSASINMWVRISSGGGGRILTYLVSGNNIITVDFTSSGYQLYSPWANPSITQAHSDETWYMVTFVNNGTDFKIFENNVEIYTVSSGAMPSGSVDYFQFGGRSGDVYFSGNIDEVGAWNRNLTLGEMTNIYNNGTGLSYPQSFPLSCVAYYRLNESSSDAIDATGNGNTGTNNNVTQNVSGKIDTCYTFNGSSSEVEISGVAGLSNYPASITAWFKVRELGVSYGLVVKVGASDADSTWDGFGFGVGGSSVENSGTNLFVVHDGIYAYGTSITISDTNWHFGVLTLTSGGFVFLLDDTYSYSSSATCYVPTLKTRIGSRGNSSYPAYFDGEIDEVGLWGRELSSAEKTYLYNNGNGETYV
jgi:hypothetical protein